MRARDMILLLPLTAITLLAAAQEQGLPTEAQVAEAKAIDPAAVAEQPAWSIPLDDRHAEILSHGATEDVAARNANSRSYTLPDGRKAAVISASPIHYRALDGSYRPAETKIVPEVYGDHYWFANGANAFRLHFPLLTDTSTDILFRLPTSEQMLLWANAQLWYEDADGNRELLLHPNDSIGLPNENTIVYHERYHNVDEVFRSKYEGLKHTYLLWDVPSFIGHRSDGLVEFSEVVTLPVGSRLWADDELQTHDFITRGDILVLDATDQPVIVFPAPWAHEGMENDFDPEQNAALGLSYRVSYLAKGQVRIGTQVPVEWLTDPERAYPVSVDPTAFFNENDRFDDCYQWGPSLFNHDADYLKVGYRSDYGVPFYLSYMNWHDVDISPGSTIDYVALFWRAYQSDNNTCSWGWVFEDADNAQPCAYQYPTERSYVSHSNFWTDYSIPWTAGEWHGVQDLKLGLQDVIERSGWAAGNNVGLKWFTFSASGGYRWLYSYDGGSSSAPYIYVEWTPGSNEHCYDCGDYDFGTFAPTSNWTTHAASFGDDGCRWYRFYLINNQEYIFTVCDGGGNFSDDPVFELYSGACGLLEDDDDTCGYGPEIRFRPTMDGPYYLKVSNWGNDAEDYTLAYKFFRAPVPDLVSVDNLPSSVNVGESFTIDITAENDLGWGGPDSSISVSVLYSDSTDNVIVEGPYGASWADSTRNFAPGEGPLYDDDCNVIPGGAVDHFVEAAENDWQQFESHPMSVTVTPNQAGTLWIRVRTTMRDGTTGCVFVNDHSVGGGTDAIDQQGWEVEQFAVTVAAQSPLPDDTWTVISHGASVTFNNPPYDGWMMDLAERIAGLDPGQVEIHWMNRDTFAIEPPAPFDSEKHHVLLWDWSATSYLGLFDLKDNLEPFADGYAYAAGDSLHAFLKYHAIEQKVFCLIGHSRGAVVVSEATRRLILDGAGPRQVIYLDGEGGNFGGFGYQDDRFDAWLPNPGSDIRYDNIFSTEDEGSYYSSDEQWQYCLPECCHCYCGLNYGGGDSGDPEVHPRLWDYNLDESYRHSHCEDTEGPEPPPIWEYLVYGMTFDGQLYRYPDESDDNSVDAPLDPDAWDGHPSDELLFNRDFEWSSLAGWRSHGGGGTGHVDSLGEPGSFLELDSNDSWRQHSWFWLRDEYVNLTFRFRVSNADVLFCNDVFRVTLIRHDGYSQELFSWNKCDQTDWKSESVEIPPEFLDQLCTIKFWKDDGGDGDIDSEVRIDDVGFLDCPPPGTPRSVIASNGLCDLVTVSWDNEPSATHYNVYRSTSNNPCSYFLGMAESTTYNDYTALPWETYYYSVRAVNGCGDSSCSKVVSGYSGSAPATPTNVSASDGICDLVTVSWKGDPVATHYDVYRSKSNSPCASYLGFSETTTYDDTTAVPGETYYYSVRAVNGCGDSGCSNVNDGYRASAPNEAPLNLSPNDGANCQSTNICLDWEDVPGATSYDVYWGTDFPPEFWSSVPSSDACPPNQDGLTYFWFVVPKNTCGDGPAGPTWSYAAGVTCAQILYVDASAPSDGCGASWETAFNDLQTALVAAAGCGGLVAEVWVAGGTYTPAPPGGDRTASFQLMSGLAIYGHFAGSESSIDERDLSNPDYETILSGDLNGDDDTGGSNAENSYHVVTGGGTDTTALLDGFTITAGNADGVASDSVGSGMYNSGSSPLVANCNFSGNRAVSGGGMYNVSSNPTVTNCLFGYNTVSFGGGGMSNVAASPTVSNCTFMGNTAGSNGGGMTNSNSASSPVVSNCTFSGNSAGGAGGAMYNLGSPSLSNSMFSGNSAGFGGAIMNVFTTGNPSLNNCTFSGNTAFSGGAMRTELGSPTLSNCVFYLNMDDGGTDESAQIHVASGSPAVSYCCIQGLTGALGGTGNIDADPRFVDPSNDDYRLAADSPCIDAADNTAVPKGIDTDLDGNPRLVDALCTPDTGHGTPPIVDMGAYEADPVYPSQSTIYVDASATTGLGNGASWEDASRDLQIALCIAETNRGVVSEIRVASGTYVPAPPDGDRALSFDLVDGVAIYGGYPPGGGDERDPALYETILSGDLNGDDDAGGDNSENSYHVLRASNLATKGTTLDGLTITRGFADGVPPDDRGGGVASDGSILTFVNCVWEGNGALVAGGALNLVGSTVDLINCRVVGNSAANGGGVATGGSDVTLINCLFSQNVATVKAGAIGGGNTAFILINCTLSGNEAPNTGGLWIQGSGSNGIVKNCVLWDNGGSNESNQIGLVGGAQLTIDYSCVQGLTGDLGGEGNIGYEPLFVDPTLGDYHLLPGSPCIDAADNTVVPPEITTDLDGNPRFVDDPCTPDCPQVPGECGAPPIVDMGAYEFQGSSCDLDGDGVVGVSDLLMLLGAWGPCPDPPEPCPADLDGDGTVGVSDLLLLLANWGAGSSMAAFPDEFELPGSSTDSTGETNADSEDETDAGTSADEVFVNDGILAPADFGGVFEVPGDYRQTANGELIIEIGGSLPVEEYDMLVIEGDAMLDGVLSVWLVDNFVPMVGQNFVIAVADSITGEFSMIDLPELSDDAICEVIYEFDRLILIVAPQSAPFNRLEDAIHSGTDWGPGMGNWDSVVDPVGDLDGNGFIDVLDVSILLEAWGEEESIADLNEDGIVDGLDLLTLLQHWG